MAGDVTVWGEDRGVHLRMTAEQPADDLSPGVWQTDAATAPNDIICSARWAIEPGATGKVSLELVREGALNCGVRLYRRYLDRSGLVLHHRQGALFTITDVPQTQTLLWVEAAPAAAVTVEVGMMMTTAAGSERGIKALSSLLTCQTTARDLLGVAFERPLRRSVADIWSDPDPLITAGTPGRRAGRLTYLCDSLAQASALEAVYSMTGLMLLTPTPRRVNLHPRPLADDTSYGTWSLAGGSHSLSLWTTGGPAAEPAIPWLRSEVTAVSTSSPVSWNPSMRVPVIAGRTYAMSAWMLQSNHYSYARRCDIRWYDSAGAVIGAVVGLSDVILTSGYWAQIGGVATAPAGAVEALVSPTFSSPQSAPVGSYRGVGTLMVEESATPGPIFTGNTPDTDTTFYSWRGSAGESVSLATDVADVDALQHRAIGQIRTTAERAIPGVRPRWLCEVEFREQAG